MLELSSNISTSGENSSSITILIVINNSQSILESISSYQNHYWSKYFLIIYAHSWLNMINHSRSNKVTLFKSFNLNTSTI